MSSKLRGNLCAAADEQRWNEWQTQPSTNNFGRICLNRACTPLIDPIITDALSAANPNMFDVGTARALKWLHY